MELETIVAGESNEIHQEHIVGVRSPSNKCCPFLPDRRKVLLTLTQVLSLLFFYASLYGILSKDALPGSEIFALLLLLVAAHIGGKLAALIKLPSLIGMLIVGFLFRNLPFLHFYENVSIRWATTLRGSALVIILLKAGLGLDAEKLKKLSLVVFQLAFAPCIVEAVVSAVASHFILGLPWPWALMLGFVVAAVSPAVIVPSLLSLQEKRFGVKKGIPTLVIAAASVDDIIAITGFTVLLSISLSEGNLVVTILKGVLEPVGGLVVGLLLGRTFWELPSKQSPSSTLIYYHITLLCLGGFTCMFLSKTLDVAGAGPMACLVMAFVAALGWKKDPLHLESIQRITSVLWSLLQPFLFSLIGAEVSVTDVQSDLGNTVLTISIGLFFRLVAASFATLGGNLNIKERIFVAFAWLPKATVQSTDRSFVKGNLPKNTVLLGQNIFVGCRVFHGRISINFRYYKKLGDIFYPSPDVMTLSPSNFMTLMESRGMQECVFYIPDDGFDVSSLLERGGHTPSKRERDRITTYSTSRATIVDNETGDEDSSVMLTREMSCKSGRIYISTLTFSHREWQKLFSV